MVTGAKPVKQSASGGKGVTKTKAKGINVNLLASHDKAYLCEKICMAKKIGLAKISKIAKLGYIVSPQLAVDGMIMLDYDKNLGKWRYIPEVSFDMGTNPPKPILATHQVFPPNYPYWGYPRAGTKRPDVIIIDGEDNYAKAQKNIIRVIEIKFGNDTLKPRQLRSYQLIAGSNAKVTVMTDDDCDCNDKNDSDDSDSKALEHTLETAVGIKALDMMRKSIGDKKLPVYASKPHPAVVPVIPKPKTTHPKPSYDYNRTILNRQIPAAPARPAGVPANAQPIRNLQTGQMEWVVPTMKVIGEAIIVGLIVFAFATGAGEVGVATAAVASFAISGTAAIRARYGTGADIINYD